MWNIAKEIEADPDARYTWDDLYTMGDEVTFEALGGTTLNANSTVRGRCNGVNEYLVPGEKASLRSLLYGAFVVSGNDAANALVTAVNGSERAYLERIRTSIKSAPFDLSDATQIGRAYGRDCYSSALDVAKIARVLMADESVSDVFKCVSGAPSTRGSVEIVKTSGDVESVERDSTHPFVCGPYNERLKALLGSDIGVYGKTGTWIEDYVLATIVERDGRTLVAVVLNTNSARKRDDTTLSLLAWGFQDEV